MKQDDIKKRLKRKTQLRLREFLYRLSKSDQKAALDLIEYTGRHKKDEDNHNSFASKVASDNFLD